MVFANPDTVWPAGAIDALVARRRGEPTIGLSARRWSTTDGTPQPIVEDDLSLGTRAARHDAARRPDAAAVARTADGLVRRRVAAHRRRARADVGRSRDRRVRRTVLPVRRGRRLLPPRSCGRQARRRHARRARDAPSAARRSTRPTTPTTPPPCARARSRPTSRSTKAALARRVFGVVGTVVYGAGPSPRPGTRGVEGGDAMTRRIVIGVPCHRDEPGIARTVASLAASADATRRPDWRIVVCVNGADPGERRRRRTRCATTRVTRSCGCST